MVNKHMQNGDSHTDAQTQTGGLHKLVAGMHQFQANVFQPQREFFRTLADGQRPQGLFITCSDSRINPNLFTQTDPGELFILRNIGNIVPPFSPITSGGGAAAAIEFAVAALNVEYIVVCGHSLCGAMKGLLQPETVADLPSVRGWLAHGESARQIVRQNYADLDADNQMNVLVQENVLVQLENLRTHPSVAVRLSRGDLRLFAWVYKLETGEVFAYHADEGQFVSLLETPVVPQQRLARMAAIRSI
ncbi:MAG: carbonic anhydrase [Pirellulales bacterium]